MKKFKEFYKGVTDPQNIGDWIDRSIANGEVITLVDRDYKHFDAAIAECKRRGYQEFDYQERLQYAVYKPTPSTSLHIQHRETSKVLVIY